jgi:probable F420-dependent oxidoreductase
VAVSVIPSGRLEWGVQLHVQAQSKTFAEPWEEGTGRDELVAIARKADEVGAFYIAVCDHVTVPRPADAHMRTTWYDPIATLGYLAALTTNVRLMSHVFVLPYRHPLMAAKQFMTLDELSGGRVIVGVGTGHLQSEFAALGADYEHRGALTDEAIDALRAALSNEYPTVDGPTWSFQDAGLAPRPRQAEVPIWVGGSSKPALRRAAARGDGWLPQGTPRDEMPAAVAYLLEHRKATLGPNVPIDIGTITETLYVGDPSWDVGARTLSGAPEPMADKLRAFRDMGVSHLQVRFRSRSLDELLDQFDAFATRIAPLLN